MKKKIILVAATLAMALTLVGCGSGEAGTEQGAQADADVQMITERGEGCFQCHGAADYRLMAEDHEGYTLEMCLTCHSTSYENPSNDAPCIPHNLDSAANVEWAYE